MNIKKYVSSYFEDWTLWEKAWLALSLVIMLVLSFYWKDSWIGILASLTGIITVILVAKGKISNYYFGIVNVIAYAYVAYQWNYYGEVMLNLLYFLPMQFYGIWIWRKNRTKKHSDDVVIRFLTQKQRIFWSSISVVGVIAYGFILKYIGGSLPFVDSISTVLSVIAMVLMAQLYMEQWILWIIVDIVSVIMWFIVMMRGGNDVAVLVMWSAFLVNAVYGLVNWIHLYKKQRGVNHV